MEKEDGEKAGWPFDFAAEHLNSKRLDFGMESNFRAASLGNLAFAAKGQRGGGAEFLSLCHLCLSAVKTSVL
jgi:hypothetical protein